MVPCAISTVRFMLRLISGIILYRRTSDRRKADQTKPHLLSTGQYTQGREVWQTSAAFGVATASRVCASIHSANRPEIAVGATSQNWRVD